MADTSEWLTTLASHDNMGRPLEGLKQKLLEAGKHMGSTGLHTFSAVGFEHGEQFVFLVSNFQRISNQQFDVIRETKPTAWKVSTSLRRTGALATGSGGQFVTPSDLRPLRGLVRRHRSDEVQRQLGRLNWEVWRTI